MIEGCRCLVVELCSADLAKARGGTWCRTQWKAEGTALRADRRSIHNKEARAGMPLASRGGQELPFSAHLAILFKVHQVTLHLHSVPSLSPVAFASMSARKSSPAGVPGGMDFGISARKREDFCKLLEIVALSSRG